MTSWIRTAAILTAVAGSLAFSASANETVRAACEADAARGNYNCDCVDTKFAAASAGLSGTQQTALADLYANTFGDTDAAMRFATVSPEVMISLPLDSVGETVETCLATNFEETIAAGEAELADEMARADALQEAENQRIAAIPTAPPPPEVTDPDSTNPLAGQAGTRAATEFRDLIIADCMSFGNTAGYCGCHADEAAKLMTPERRRAYFVSSKVGLRATDGEISWDDVDQVTAAELGTTVDQVEIYRAQWNQMVQSEPYLDISYACEAYR